MSARIAVSQFYRLLGIPLLLLLSMGAEAQTGSANLHGQVTDPTGAVIPDASVQAKSSAGKVTSTKTDGAGGYELKNLIPGDYVIVVQAEGFGAFTKKLALAEGTDLKLDFPLKVAAQSEVVVEGQTPGVDLNPANNASAIVIKGQDLDALSDDPDTLQAELNALAGPSIGPNGGEIYVDGFSGAQLPPKSAIREIRINQNMLSAQYDKPGLGRIEIFTQPGTDKFHGTLAYNTGDWIFDSRSLFAPQRTDWQQWTANLALRGPINKKGSFSFVVDRRQLTDISMVNAILPDPTNPLGVAFNQQVPSHKTWTVINPRIDYKLTNNNTITVNYSFSDNRNHNDGIGNFSLPSQGYNGTGMVNSLQITDSQILGPKAVSDAHFEFIHTVNRQIPISVDPSVSVPGAFMGGGNGNNSTTTTDHYEFSDGVSLSRGNHIIRFGGRIRANGQSNSSTANFNGAFTYKDLPSYQAGIPEFFTITTGLPGISQTMVDAAVYGEDDWHLHPKVMLSYGLRFETQNAIHDHGDYAPRVMIAWSPDGTKKTPAKTVVRAGFGLFYDRFGQSQVLQTERLNGINQQQLLVQFKSGVPIFSPSTIPSIDTLKAQYSVAPSIYKIAPNLHAPYFIQSGFIIDRDVTKIVKISVAYLNSRGLHQLLIRDINAPLPDSNPPARALGGVYGTSNVYEYESIGITKQSQAFANIRINAGPALTLGTWYSYGNAHSDTSGPGSYVSNDFNVKADYGRTSFDIHHRVGMFASFALPYYMRLNPLFFCNSGQPYNVVAPVDLNGDGLLNDRPAFAPDRTLPGVILTPNFPVSALDIAPTSQSQLLPPYYGTASSRWVLNLTLNKAIGFGPKNAPPKTAAAVANGVTAPAANAASPAAKKDTLLSKWSKRPDQKYTLTFTVSAVNVLNHANFGLPISVVGPRLGQSYAGAGFPFSPPQGNRHISFITQFAF